VPGQTRKCAFGESPVEAFWSILEGVFRILSDTIWRDSRARKILNGRSFRRSAERQNVAISTCMNFAAPAWRESGPVAEILRL